MLKFKTFFEKRVYGVIEDITIHGVGNVSAKLDSGNGGFNVISATEMVIQGTKITFLTINNKRLTETIVDTVTINVGGGNTEQRPVILLRMKIGDDEFDNVKFSLSDRSTNKHGVLISKDFIVNELDGLINPGEENIADKQIEVGIT